MEISPKSYNFMWIITFSQKSLFWHSQDTHWYLICMFYEKCWDTAIWSYQLRFSFRMQHEYFIHSLKVPFNRSPHAIVSPSPSARLNFNFLTKHSNVWRSCSVWMNRNTPKGSIATWGDAMSESGEVKNKSNGTSTADDAFTTRHRTWKRKFQCQ